MKVFGFPACAVPHIGQCPDYSCAFSCCVAQRQAFRNLVGGLCTAELSRFLNCLLSRKKKSVVPSSLSGLWL